MSLTDLPYELLTIVAHNIPAEKDLNCLAQTSRYVYNIINPYLYHHQISDHHSSALLWAAQHLSAASCRRLLQEGANAEVRDTFGQTPLILAAFNGHETILRLLLADKHVDPDTRDGGGRTAFSWAAWSGHLSILEILLAMKRVDPDSQDWSS